MAPHIRYPSSSHMAMAMDEQEELGCKYRTYSLETDTPLFCVEFYSSASELGNFTSKGSVLILHGMAEHCLWYDQIAKLMLDKGFSVYAHNHRGATEAKKRKIHFDQLVEDTIAHLRLITKKDPEKPIFVLAHSIGATVALHCLNKCPGIISGLVLLGAALVPDKKIASPLKLKVGSIIAKLAPTMVLDTFRATNLFSHNDPVTVTRWQNDACINRQLLAGFGMESLKAIVQTKLIAPKLTLPFLLAHGSNDKMASIEGCEMMQKATSTLEGNKTIRIYENGSHRMHLENTKTGQQVRSDILNWMLERV